MSDGQRKEAASLLATLKRHDLRPFQVDDGEEMIASPDPVVLLDAIMSVDEARLYVTDPTDELGATAWLFLVWGNDPGELVADYSLPPALEARLNAASDEHAKRWENRKH